MVKSVIFFPAGVYSVVALGRLGAQRLDARAQTSAFGRKTVEVGHEHYALGVRFFEHLLKHLDQQVVVIHHRFDRQCRHGKFSQPIGESLAVEFVGKVRGGEMLQAFLLGTMHKIDSDLVVAGL